RKKHQPQSRPTPSIQFIREGEKPSSSKKTKKGLLQTAPSWEMRVDLGRKLHFPQVVQTSLRPDMVIWSEEAKKIILIELTVPWEEGCGEESHQVPGPCPSMQGQGMAGLAIPSGGRMQGLPGTVCVEYTHSSGNKRKGEEDSCPQVGGSRRESLLLALE